MTAYKLSPYLEIIENRLTKGAIEFGLFHRLSGEIVEFTTTLQMFVTAVRKQGDVHLDLAQLENQPVPNTAFVNLIHLGFLIETDQEPIVRFLDHYVVRPLQNPAVGYRLANGEIVVVRIPMDEYVFGRRQNDLPTVIEETLPPLASEIFANADGTKTLRQILELVDANPSDANEALEFLTTIERQFIKLTSDKEDSANPFKPCNIIGRDLFHAGEAESISEIDSVTEFHLGGIEDGGWEFDQIEPTINHAFRFPGEVFDGLSYGARFCASVLGPFEKKELDILEVGGGTGSFASSFIEESQRRGIDLNYHILDLSPVLIGHQKRALAESGFEVTHFHQNATEFDLPGRTFDLIVSNEVIADFPVAEVRCSRDENGEKWDGPGLQWVEKYSLETPPITDQFLVNSGVFEFLERAWKHLREGGRFIVTEYGGENSYPVQAIQLNHEEFSIHFGHVKKCATQIGFECELVPLKNFLAVNDQASILDGRELRILCLNHIFRSHDLPAMTYSAWSSYEFERQYGDPVNELNLIGLSFSPLRGGFHFTPEIDLFMALIMNKPRKSSGI